MSNERRSLLIPETNTAPIDGAIFARHEAARGTYPATFEQLNVGKGRLKAAEQSFVESGFTLDVDLRANPEDIDLHEVNAREERLKKFKHELLSDESIPSDLVQAYRWAVNERIANLHIIEASAVGNMRAFRGWNEFIYGEPDPAVYSAALDWICNDAEALTDSDNPLLAAAAQKVIERFGEQRGDRSLLVPDTEVFQAIRADHFRPFGYYALLLDGTTLPKNQKITPANGDVSLKHVVAVNLQSNYDIVDAPGVTWSVAHAAGQVRRPSNHNMEYERYVGLGLGHEVGSHLLETVNGQRGPVRLASIGLDRTDLGNEGRAIIREAVMYETFEDFAKLLRWRDIVRRHIAVSIGEGVGENRPQGFSETYTALNTIDTMYALREGKPEKAHSRSWNLTTDVMMGTDGKGGANLRRKVYLEGLIASWRTAKARGPKAIAEGDLAKSDINNPRHIKFLQDNGVLPVEDII